MTRIDGSTLARSHAATYDVVVVGSGPAGAAAAARIAASGASIAVVEEGGWIDTTRGPHDLGTAFARAYRHNGMAAMIGSPPTPYLQGMAVGGTSVVNGAISWRLPQDVFATWLRRDPGLAAGLDWQALTRETDRIETRLNIHPTDPATAGPRNLLMATGADALGLEHRPIRRNVRHCRGAGYCVEGCPNGAKLSMDRTLLLDAEADGADILSGVKVRRLLTSSGQIRGVRGTSRSGQPVDLQARHAVVLAASAVQSPVLLLQSGIQGGPVGQHFQCHPGVSVSGRFSEPVHNWIGATQGHEVIGLRREGLKFESIAMDISVTGMRRAGAGATLMRNLQEARHVVEWGAAVKSTAHGRVHHWRGRPLVRWSPTRRDVLLFRRGAAVLGRMLLAAGAETVDLDVHGWATPVGNLAQLTRFEERGPNRATDYHFAATHMFGTCRMGSDPARSVVGPRFEHHQLSGLFIADSSVFPTNTGVNPQTSILAMASICGDHVVNSARL